MRMLDQWAAQPIVPDRLRHCSGNAGAICWQGNKKSSQGSSVKPVPEWIRRRLERASSRSWRACAERSVGLTRELVFDARGSGNSTPICFVLRHTTRHLRLAVPRLERNSRNSSGNNAAFSTLSRAPLSEMSDTTQPCSFLALSAIQAVQRTGRRIAFRLLLNIQFAPKNASHGRFRFA
jgi:hypothetical protein